MISLFNFLNYLISYKSGFVFQIAICETLYMLYSKPRKLPWVTIPLALAAFLLFGLFVPSFNIGAYSGVITSLVIFFVSILLQFAVMKLPFNRVMFNCIAAYATQNLAINAYESIQLLTGLVGWSALIVKYVIIACVYLSCYFLFAKKGQREQLNIKRIYLYVVAFITLLTTNLFYAVLNHNVGVYVETKGIGLFCCFLCLVAMFSIFQKGNLKKESEILEQLLHMEQKRHALSKENIDIITTKCNELKKQIADLHPILSDDAKKIISEVEQAVMFYDDSVDTGNNTLDLVLNEKKLFCDKHNISLSTNIDGALLNFMTPFDIYTLFGNALENAVESIINESESDRYIGLNVHKNGEYVCIEIKNFCTRQIDFEGGRPVVNKNNNRPHGYGIKSMEYVIDKYDGNMVIVYEDSIFFVKIIIKYFDCPATS